MGTYDPQTARLDARNVADAANPGSLLASLLGGERTNNAGVNEPVLMGALYQLLAHSPLLRSQQVGAQFQNHPGALVAAAAGGRRQSLLGSLGPLGYSQP